MIYCEDEDAEQLEYMSSDRQGEEDDEVKLTGACVAMGM